MGITIAGANAVNLLGRGPAVYHSPRKGPLAKTASKQLCGPQPARLPWAYKAELDAAMTGGGVALPMTSREEVILTATSPSWLRTTWPAASKQIGSMPLRFEGQSMTISR